MLAENIPALCWIASAKGSIFWFNRRWHEYCGTTHDQMVGGGWQSVHDREVLPEIMKEWDKSFAVGKPFEMTMPLRGADGGFRPFLTQINPAFDDNGKLIRWIGVHTDISLQVAAEAKLASAQGQMRTIVSYREAVLRQLAEGIILTDPNGRILFVNEAANKLHGVKKLDVEPEDYSVEYSLFTEDGEAHPFETLPLSRAVVQGETVIGARWMIRRPDGSEVLALGNAQPVYAENGDKIGAVLTIRDDTSRHATEKALAEALHAKEALLYEVNHRVKNSLQIVTSLLTLQAEAGNTPELKHSLREARSRVDIVAGLHRRLYADGLHGSVDLGGYVHEFALETISAFADKDAIELDFSCPNHLTLDMDQAVPIALIVGELLTNAVKYAFDGETENRITLNILASDNAIEVSVADNGKGLPENFDPATTAGLGMRIVLALAQQLSGKIAARSAQPGAEFVVTFPPRTAAP